MDNEKEFIQDILDDLQHEFDLNDNAMKQIKKEMANYALAAVMDSHIRKEAENICKER